MRAIRYRLNKISDRNYELTQIVFENNKHMREIHRDFIEAESMKRRYHDEVKRIHKSNTMINKEAAKLNNEKEDIHAALREEFGEDYYEKIII